MVAEPDQVIIDCALRAHGWDTTLLGASTNPMRLNQYLQDLGPEAVAVSCSVLGSLPTCQVLCEIVHPVSAVVAL
jgi:hypothetical protein